MEVNPAAVRRASEVHQQDVDPRCIHLQVDQNRCKQEAWFGGTAVLGMQSISDLPGYEEHLKSKSTVNL